MRAKAKPEAAMADAEKTAPSPSIAISQPPTRRLPRSSVEPYENSFETAAWE